MDNLSFADMLAKAQSAPESRQEVIDLSQFLGDGASVTLRDLDAPRIFAIPEAAKGVKKRNLEFPAPLCESIAMLSLAHVAPAATGQVDDFYSAIAKNNSTLFMHLLTRYCEAFPALSSLGAEDDDGKKDLPAEQASS